MKGLVKSNFSRKYWAIMKTFNVLPTEDRFKELTDLQVNFIIENMNLDAKIEERLSKGLDPNNVMEDDDDSWWYEDYEDFDPIVEGHDEADIVAQADAKLSEAERRKMEERFDAELSSEEVNELIRKNKHDSIRAQIDKNIEEALDEANNGKFTDTNKGMQNSLSNTAKELFEDDDDDWI